MNPAGPPRSSYRTAWLRRFGSPTVCNGQVTEPRPNGRRDEAVAALANEGAESRAHASSESAPSNGTAGLPDEAVFDLVTATPPSTANPESTLLMTPDETTPADSGPHADPGAPPAWSGASPAPAGIPQRRVVVRTQPELAATAMPRHPARRPPDPRRASHGLPLLVLLSLLALFVAWVSAEPFWLAIGHQDTGTVEVTRCTGHGPLGTRCIGTFTTTHRGYAADAVTVSGAAPANRKVGKELPARMVSAHGRIAYAGDTAGLHLRWLSGLGLLLAIGLGIGAVTGAWRFRGGARVGAVSASLLTPILIALVALALTY